MDIDKNILDPFSIAYQNCELDPKSPCNDESADSFTRHIYLIKIKVSKKIKGGFEIDSFTLKTEPPSDDKVGKTKVKVFFTDYDPATDAAGKNDEIDESGDDEDQEERSSLSGSSKTYKGTTSMASEGYEECHTYPCVCKCCPKPPCKKKTVVPTIRKIVNAVFYPDWMVRTSTVSIGP